MAQIFPRSANTLARVSLAVVALGAGGLLTFAYLYTNSPYETQVDIVKQQPVPFSHEHHVTGLGIDCRYCHTSVEISSNANVPPTHTCMSCHSQIWNQSPMLAPVRQSLAEDRPLAWTRVHDLADFVYFNHAAHVNKGVGCVECHGRVDKMPLTWKAESMTMSWCLQCHENPAEHMRKPEDIFNLASAALPAEEGRKLVEEYKIQTDRLTSCSMCHR